MSDISRSAMRNRAILLGAIDRVSEYQKSVVETLNRARKASSEEERAKLFSIAEEISSRARRLDKFAKTDLARSYGS